MSDNLLVSVCSITYNHEKYIRDAINGFLIQRTNFPFEIIIHDDASTDRTGEIIKEYAEKYPKLIFPIFQTENQQSRDQGAISPRFVWPHARGKYIALCEGDDYWTDPYKLQKQVDFLENNPEYSMCFHNAKVISEIHELNDSLYTTLENKDYNSDELLKTWIVPTASVVSRREFVNLVPQSKKFMFGDIIMILTMAEYGKVHCINEVMSAYRRTLTGAVLSQKKNSFYYIRRSEHFKEISHYFPKVSKITIDNLIIEQNACVCLSFLKQVSLKQFMFNYLKFFREYSFDFVIRFNMALVNSIKIRLYNK